MNATVYDPQAYSTALERMRSAPLELTSADFDQLEIVDPSIATKAFEARRAAQLALVSPALATKSVDPPQPAPWMSASLGQEVEVFLQKYGTKHATNTALWEMFTSLLEVARDQKNAIKTLETRIKHLEARPSAKYVGVWKSGETYSEGSLATHQGSLWLAIEAKTNGTPGTPASGWRLVVKQGRA